MAIIFEGSSKCAICGEVLKKTDEIVGLPAISDTEHPLYKYFDTGFHKSCMDNWDKKPLIQSILLKENPNWKNLI